MKKTNAVGLKATAGRYGGTYAHRDIAFEFGMWISPEFKIYLIKEFQRFKNEESEKLRLGWDVKRELAKINYKIHTDAIKARLIPLRLTKQASNMIYATEADVTQLVVLTNLEGINAELIRRGLPQAERLTQLNRIAITQMQSLVGNVSIKKIK